MSQHAVEVVRSLYQAWNEGDMTAGIQLIHPEVEWETSGVFPGMDPLYRGHEGVRRFWRDLRDPFERFVIHPRRLESREGWVLAELSFDAIGRQSGATVTLDFVNALLVRERLIVRYASRPTYDEALEAAGLLE